MAIGRRFVGGVEKSLFVPGGRYWQIKEKLAGKAKEKGERKAEKKNQKESNKVRIECELIVRDALDRAKHLEGKEKAALLDSALNAVYKRLNIRDVGLTGYDMEKVSGAIMELMKGKGKR